MNTIRASNPLCNSVREGAQTVVKATPPNVLAGEHDITHVIKIAAWTVGFGSYFAWDYLKVFSGVVQPSFAQGGGTIYMTIAIATTTAVLMFCAIWAPRFTHLVRRGRAMIVGAVASSAGTLLSAVPGEPGRLSPMCVAGAVLVGYGLANLTLSWGEALASLDPREAGIRVLGAFVFCVATYFVVTLALRESAALIVTAVLPCVSIAVLLLQFPAIWLPEPARSFSLAGSGILQRWRLWVGMGVYAAAVTLVMALTPTQDAHSFSVMHTVTFMLAGLAALGLLSFLSPRGLPLGAVYRLVLPVMVAGLFFIVVPVRSNWVIANFLIRTGFTVLDLVVWCLLAEIGYRTRTSCLVVFGWGKSMIACSCLLGLLLGLGLQSVVAASSPTITAAALATAFLLIIAASFVLSAGDIRQARLWESGMGRRSAEVSANAQPDCVRDNAFSDPDAPFRSSCKAIVEAHDLSPRESEVLELLARGRDAAHIQATLYISRGTANTHISHIYRKLGVHSHQELLDYFDSRRLPARDRVSQ